MSKIISKWKDSNKSAGRLNCMLAVKRQLPNRFSPHRDISRDSDKLFDRSITMYNSSLDHTALNRTKGEEQNIAVRMLKQSSLVRRSDREERKTQTVVAFPTTVLGREESNQTQGQSYMRSSVLLNDLKKQFLAFKTNMLMELDRQRQMVQKVIKEVVLTIQYEFEKISSQFIGKKTVQEPLNFLKTQEIKSIEQWKHSLERVSLSQYKNKSINANKALKSVVPLIKTSDQPSMVNLLPPPSCPQLECAAFLNSIDSLQKKIIQMEGVLAPQGQKIN